MTRDAAVRVRVDAMSWTVPGYDVVVRALPPASRADWTELAADYAKAWRTASARAGAPGTAGTTTTAADRRPAREEPES